jgi:hypothetical protein
MTATGIPNKQRILDYFCERMDQRLATQQVADALGLSTEDAEIAIEALAYEKELAKEYDEAGARWFRRKA